jgi:hypothetical protein
MADENKPSEPLTELDCRMFIIEHMADADIDGGILVRNMDLVCRWLWLGEVPEAPGGKKASARVKLEANG